MASVRWVVKQQREPKFKTRKYNRCALCGRRRGYYRKFKVCRLCFRRLANASEIPGVRKASW